jgi:hypothetical protein
MSDKTKNFNLDERDIKYIQSVARTNGNCSDSAALRIVIREHKQLTALKPDFTTVSLTNAGEKLSTN